MYSGARRPPTLALILALAAVLLLPLSCTSESDGPAGRSAGQLDYWPTDEWLTAEPAEVGIDGARLASMLNWLAREGDRVDGVVVVRHGRIALEVYRPPYRGDIPHALYSCTKSVTSACIGIAIDQGLLPGVDTPVDDLFPDYQAGAGYHTDSGPVTLEHLLTMTTGLDARDSYLYNWSGNLALRAADDWIAYALSLPSVAPPGTRYDYSNTASFLLSAAIQEAAGITTEQFAAQYLFGPLGINEWRWGSSPQGITLGGTELRLLPRDFAKFGLLYLHGGEWDGQQIVPASWVERSWTETVAANTLQPTYGYQWWMDDEGAYMATGYRGQYLIINPELDLVMVVVSTLPESDFLVPYSLYEYFVRPATENGPDSADARYPELDQAIEAFESAEAVMRRDAIPSAMPPSDAARYSGTWDVDENPWGIMALSVEFDAEDTSAGGFTVTFMIPEAEVRFPIPHSGGTALVQNDWVRAGWDQAKNLAILWEGVGRGWYRRMTVRFFPDQIQVTARNENGDAAAYTGVRR